MVVARRHFRMSREEFFSCSLHEWRAMSAGLARENEIKEQKREERRAQADRRR